MHYTTRRETFFLVIGVGLEIASAVLLYVITHLCAGQCLLYGRVFERKRVLEGGFMGWCHLPFAVSIAAIASAIFLLKFLKGGKLSSNKVQIQNSTRKACVVVIFTTMLTFFAARIISEGFQVWCSSFVINRCIDRHIDKMDWKQFSPKYSDCSQAYKLLSASEICSWGAFAVWCILCVTHVARVLRGTKESNS